MSPNSQVEVTTPESLIIDGWEYDISKFQHPGGRVIRSLIGQDASNHFKEFHYRTDKPLKVLNSLPKKRVSVSSEQVLKDFAEWRSDLERRGFFEPSYVHVGLRLLEIVVLFGLGVYFIPINIYLSLIFFGLFGGKCGWVQHEGGHSSLTGNPRWDKVIQTLTVGPGMLMERNIWNLMHNKHHATPQKIKHDSDLNTSPWVAFFKDTAEYYGPSSALSAFSRLWLKLQVWTFVPITSGILVNGFWAFKLHPTRIIRERHIFGGLAILGGYILRTWVFYYFGGFSLLQSVGLLLCSMWLCGMHLFGQFALSHTFTPVIPPNENPTWVEYAINHSVDIEPENPLVCWVMGYLNCQVIHHLFPTMPQFRQPQLSKELQILAKKWNMNYQVLGYWEAWGLMLSNLQEVGSDPSGKKNLKTE